MSLQIVLGTSEFRELRGPGVYYADKTGFIRELLDTPDKASLFLRPRRFGKSALLSMLRAFFEKGREDLAPLFQDLQIWQAGEAYLAHFQRYPVLSLSFKEAKAATWDGCSRALADELGGAAEQHRYLLDEGVLYPNEVGWFTALLDRRPINEHTWRALRDLSSVLHRHHGQRALILLDEYDTPILAGYQYGYFDEVCLFFRNLFSAGLKDNPHLFRGVLTGILRIAKEDLFSGPNNIMTYDVLHRRFATGFGFTEAEVEGLMGRVGRLDALPVLRQWYNGYLIGGQVIYNPWSVLHFARDPEAGCRPYWVHTGSDDVLRGLVLQQPYLVVDEMRQLMEGRTITKQVDDFLTLRDLYRTKGAVWTLLLHSGYLKATEVRNEQGEIMADLCIPNQEVRTVYKRSILNWIGSGSEPDAPLDQLLFALLSGDTRTFASRLADVAVQVLSFHDTAGREPEKVYQAFTLGLLVRLLPRYEVDSNRERGLGRYNTLVLPRERGQPGAVLEFKVASSASSRAVQAALKEALEQIEEKGHVARLRGRGAEPILSYAVACHGKQVWVKRAGERTIHGMPLRQPARGRTVPSRADPAAGAPRRAEGRKRPQKGKKR